VRRRSHVKPRAVILGGAVVRVLTFVRAMSLRWGATAEETNLFLPGDDLMRRSDVTSTRAITVAARSALQSGVELRLRDLR
jgi:hypothetical protein